MDEHLPCSIHAERLATLESRINSGIDAQLETLSERMDGIGVAVGKIQNSCAAHQVMTVEVARQRVIREAWERDVMQTLDGLREARTEMKSYWVVISILAVVLMQVAQLALAWRGLAGK